MAVLIPDGTGAMIEPEDIRVQDNSGIWESVPAVMAPGADGIWEQVWPTKKYLYKSGDECTAVTGGWLFPDVTDNGNFLDSMRMVDGNVCERKKTSDSLTLKCISKQYSSALASTYTAHKIYANGKTKLHMIVNNRAIGSIRNSIIVMGKDAVPNGIRYDLNNLFRSSWGECNDHELRTDYHLEFDIGSISEGFYLSICNLVYDEEGNTSNMETVIKKVWLE